MGSASSPWSPVETADGSFTLRQVEKGEACHSRSGAWLESRERYAGPARLRERARAGELRVCRLLDVGTGLGLNLAAALEALDGSGARLDVVSLETDPDVLAAALACAERARTGVPPARWYSPVLAAFEAALEEPGRAAEGLPLGSRGDRLRLLIGDGRATLPALEPEARFDAVFLDPFSPGADPPLWEPEFLGEIAARMAPGSWLTTYTASFRVRCRLARAGLRVGVGPRVGAKAEGTVASPDGEPEPLPPRVARRLARRIRESDGAPEK